VDERCGVDGRLILWSDEALDEGFSTGRQNLIGEIDFLIVRPIDIDPTRPE
jgi:hypothetical protein